ncbi:MAG: hypothetical protein GXP33_02450 [Spirochaetes bacterium]|nr:hypothetical protein [Spirochaetota bacterium]
MSTVLILILGSVFISTFFLIPLSLGVIVFLFYFNKFKRPKLTKIQIDKLVELTDNKLTIKKVSEATGVSEKKVKKYLNELVYKGDLEISTNSYDLVYYKSDLQIEG